MNKERLMELAGMQLNEAGDPNKQTVYVIKRREDGYVDKGGRKTLTLHNAFMWRDENKAKDYLDAGREKIYVAPGDSLDGFKVVPLTLTIGK